MGWWRDVGEVVGAEVPLCIPLLLGFCSVRARQWSSDECERVNWLVCFITLPLYTLQFVLRMDPHRLNYRFVAADILSKVLILLVLALCVWCLRYFCGRGSYCYLITGFSLSTLTNSLVVGIPLLHAMYGQEGVELVVQLSILQATVWLPLVLLMLELWRVTTELQERRQVDVELQEVSNEMPVVGASENQKDVVETGRTGLGGRVCTACLAKDVCKKLLANPNFYACYVGLAWAFLAKRFRIQMPAILEDSVLIMSKANPGMAMFSMGQFIALQDSIFERDSISTTFFSMVLRLVVGPAVMWLSSMAVGLRGDALRIAILQAALPQSITSFIYARDYGLHAKILSNAVTLGMLVSLPFLIGYYKICS